MRHFKSSIAIALATVAFTACQTQSADRHVHLNMTRDALRATFGEPSRIERTASGEDWYYSIRTWSKPEVGGETYHDPYAGGGSVAFTVSRTWTTEEEPVHLSSDGYVIEPVPTGKIVGK